MCTAVASSVVSLPLHVAALQSVTASSSPSRSTAPTPSPSFVPQVPRLAVGLSLIGGGAAAVRSSGAAPLLRQALADLMGIPGTTTTFKSITTGVATFNTSTLRGLNTTAAGDLVGTPTANLTTEAINATDPMLNAPLAGGGRRLQQGGVTCTRVDVWQTVTTETTVAVASLDLELTVPAAYYIAMGARSPFEMEVVAADLRARLELMLANATMVATATASFLTAWSNCTGLPAAVGVFASITTPSVPSPVTTGSVAPAIIGGVLGSAVAICLVCCVWCCFLGRRMPCAVDHQCATGYSVQVPPLRADGKPVTLHLCDHVSVRGAVEAAMTANQLPLDAKAVGSASLVHGIRILAVEDHGKTALADVGITAASTRTSPLVVALDAASATAAAGRAAVAIAAAAAGSASKPTTVQQVIIATV